MSELPRVLLLSYDDVPALGGQGRVVAGMRSALQAQGAVVETISGRGEHTLSYPARTRRAPIDFSWFLWRHPQLMNGQDADVVHAHGGPGGVLLLRQLVAPLVYTAHHTYRQAHSRLSWKRLAASAEARGYRLARRVLAVSRSTANSVIEMGISSSKVEVLPPGILVPAIAESDRDPNRVLFVGRWESGKGVLDAARVMLDLADRHPDFHGAIAGEGSQARELTQVLRADKSGRIAVLGRLGEEELSGEYSRAAVVLMPSQYEGLGLVAAEALAHGCAVAGYDVVGLHDVSPFGMELVPRDDRSALTEAVSRLIADPEARTQMAATGRSHVETAYSWSQHAQRLLEIYRSL